MAPPAKIGLRGRVVTMDPAHTVLDDGVVWIAGNRIKFVTPFGPPAPQGFAASDVKESGGTIYPGLIELHNHLSYNCLKLWRVPQLYANRDQWTRHPDYRKLISGPARTLGATDGYPAALVRYVEAKCLLCGVTTSQGITLQSLHLSRFYKGVVRNVEVKTLPELPAASAKIGDVEARDASKFLARLRKLKCMILHLAEGRDPIARSHFTDLKLADGSWALAPSLVGIHCSALKAGDFDVMAKYKVGMVWSPLSNLLLYGETADIAAAKAAGVDISLGSDWSPSGSKNLLAELKIAKAASDMAGGVFSDRELVELVTTTPAKRLDWGVNLASLEAEKIADLIVVAGFGGDPYRHLIEANEDDLRLVMINGVMRVATSKLMSGAADPEAWTLGAKPVVLNLLDEDCDPLVAGVTLAGAKSKLEEGLARIRELAEALEHPHTHAARALAAGAWTIVLDNEEPPGAGIRPRIQTGAAEITRLSLHEAAAPPLSQVLEPLELDAVSVADDGAYRAALKAQPNLPAPIKAAL
jgi:cytosine/adenosine deaminase-related metal-dependent hydrolase